MAIVVIAKSRSSHARPHIVRTYVSSAMTDEGMSAVAHFIFNAYGVSNIPTERAKMLIETNAHEQTVEIPGSLTYRIRVSTETRLTDDVRDHLYPWVRNAQQAVSAQVSFISLKENFGFENTHAILAEFDIK